MISSARKGVLAAALLMLAASARAYDEAEAKKTAEYMKKYRFETVTTPEGLSFSIPSDMPIERKNGLVTPVPFEEYLYIKFSLLEERIRGLEQRLDKMEEKLSKKFDELKAEVHAKGEYHSPPPQQAS